MTAIKNCSTNKIMTKEALEKLVLQKAVGEWGCEDLTGVTVEACDPTVHGRNWTVIYLQNEDLPAAEHTVLKIVEELGQQYDLAAD